MGRTEHFHDPNAPIPNSIVVAAVAFVQDEDGRVLLIQRSDNGLWAMPGGVQEPGEYIAQTAERETLEETGYRADVTGLIGVYSDPRHIIAYDDGEIRQQFALSFRAKLVGGSAKRSDESLEVAWFSKSELGNLEIHTSVRMRLDHGYSGLGAPYVG